VREDGKRNFGEEMGEGLPVAIEVAAQEFDGCLRQALLNGSDATLVVIGTAIGKIIAVDDRNHDMREAHSLDGIRQSHRLVDFEGRRLFERFDRTKPTTPGTFLARDHEGGRAARPAVVNVRTARFFADRVKLVP